MQFDVHWIDVSPYLNSGQPPVFMLKRPLAHGEKVKGNYGFQEAEIARVGEHWVPQANVTGDTPWSLIRAGDFVRIPVFAYRTERALASVWGLGLQVGLAAIEELRKHTHDVPHTAVLILGHEITDIPGENAFRCYVGLALQTK